MEARTGLLLNPKKRLMKTLERNEEILMIMKMLMQYYFERINKREIFRILVES